MAGEHDKSSQELSPLDMERILAGEREGDLSPAELAELRKVNAQLRMERDLLKRATAFWVKESGQ